MADALRNFAPRTVWTGDNLDILRGLNSETVDLIYLDPPVVSQFDSGGDDSVALELGDKLRLASCALAPVTGAA